MKTTKKKITREEYQNLLAILNSKDKESIVVGLMTLNSYDYNTNIVYIKMLLKQSGIDFNLLEKHAPKIYKKQSDIITFNNIWNDIKYKEDKIEKEEIVFFLEEWNNFLLNTLKISKCEFIDDITIKIEFNGKLK